MHAAPDALERFPFGHDWQQALFKVLLTDDGFAHAAAKFLRPEHFEADVLRWGFDAMLRHRETYGAFPSLLVLSEHARKLDPSIRPAYQQAIDQLTNLAVPDEKWIRDGTIEFIRRHIFNRAIKETRELYNSGRTSDAYDVMRERIDDLYQTDWEAADECWFFDELPERQGARWRAQRDGDAIGTGIPELDRILDGGLHSGELGIWIAYPKVGKTTMLMHHGFIATRGNFKNTIHFVLEGSRSLVENRYEAAFTGELYTRVKRGEIDAHAYAIAFEEYKYLRRKLLIRGMTDTWEYTVQDVHNVLRERKRRDGWVPDLIVLDYADLLVGRKKNYSSEYASQADAYKDLKTLASRDNGYRIWTAAQAKRPESKEFDTKPHILKSREIAGMYDKVRVTDFLGSINATVDEQRHQQIRLYAELYRDNEAQKEIPIHADFSRMKIGRLEGPVHQSAPTNGKAVLDPSRLGYDGWVQSHAKL